MPHVINQIQNIIPPNVNLATTPNNSNQNLPQTNDLTALNNLDYMISAFQKALTGMAFKIDGDKMGEMVVDKVEREVFA